jgi:hypothetical protein
MSLSEEDVVDVDATEDIIQNPREFSRWLYENFLRIRARLTGGTGITGTFTTVDGKTITVANGIITSITP